MDGERRSNACGNNERVSLVKSGEHESPVIRKYCQKLINSP